MGVSHIFVKDCWYVVLIIKRQIIISTITPHLISSGDVWTLTAILRTKVTVG